MGIYSKSIFITLPLLAVVFLLQSCDEQEIQPVQPVKQTVQFSLDPESAHSQEVRDLGLPEDARALISIASADGISVLSEHEIAVQNDGGVFTTEPVELAPGSYMVTELLILSDDTELFVTPKKGSEFTTSEAGALPFNFAIRANGAPKVSMQVMDVQNQDLRKFGYPASKSRSLSVAVFDNGDGSLSSIGATAELRQKKALLQTFSLSAGTNAIALEGDPKLPYTITLYTGTSAKTHTFKLKDLKKEIGKNPWRVVLEPALVIGVESYVEEGNEYEEYFNFRMEGEGSVNINWGDGEESATTLPFEVPHEYITGNYTAIITGDIDQVTDFSGFSYSTIIKSIDGLTNLVSLKTYNPSWGAVPIKVDLSNCKQLETINIAKYGAPIETIDLRTDFKLPSDHYIKTFIFDATSFDMNREFISAEELAAFVDNIHGNAVARNITDGKFFVNPVVSPAPETQEKLDVLTGDQNWQVGFNDDIYNAYESDAARGRMASDADERRDQWLRERFSNSQQIIERGRVFSSVR